MLASRNESSKCRRAMGVRHIFFNTAYQLLYTIAANYHGELKNI